MQNITLGKMKYPATDWESRVSFDCNLRDLGQNVAGSNLTGTFGMYISTNGTVDSLVFGDGTLGIEEYSSKTEAGKGLGNK
jgi:hypothetical protein